MAQANARDFAAEAAGAPVRESISAIPIERPKVKVNFAKQFQERFEDEETGNDQPERFLMETMQMRPRSNSHHTLSVKVPSRKWLKVKARWWRALMTFGMTFHDGPRPRAPKPSFVRKIATDTIPIGLYFYVPKDYEEKRKSRTQTGHRYPIVVNFHGGGFVLGHATDDRYWARVVLAHTHAVFVSVDYRRAPEHPFPQPVDDCVEALLYLQSHAEELCLDPSKIALSGFSAGANLAFTVPFRLTYQYEKVRSTTDLPFPPRRKEQSEFVPDPESPSIEPVTSGDQREQALGLLTPLPDINVTPTSRQDPGQTPISRNESPWSSAVDLSKTHTTNSNNSRTNLLNIPGPRSALIRTQTSESYRTQKHLHTNNNDSTDRLPRSNLRNETSDSLSRSRSSSTDTTPPLRIVSILAWYPLLDWTSSRASKKRGSRNPKKTLPALFTDLFDFSYLPAPDLDGLHCSPYASPSLAANHMIVDGLPQRVQMWLCEWDMLLHEGEQFSRRLKELGKDVQCEMIQGVPHGWDKSPNPFRDQKSIDTLYKQGASYLRSVFGEAERRMTVGEGIGFGGMR